MDRIVDMATEIEIHPIQIKILRVLLFKKEAKFSELNLSKITNDHFSFHVKKLLELELIEKLINGKYTLTKKGKEFANRLDTERKQIERQGKVAICILCVKYDKGETKYLVSQRLKQPYYGFYGFVTGKVGWGETVLETAECELREETGLKAKLKLAGIEHKIDYSKQGKLLEDKYFFVVKGEKTEGKLIKKFKGGKNFWFTEKEILALPNIFDDMKNLIKILNNNSMSFLENKFIVKKY